MGLLNELIIVFALSITVFLLFHKLHIPAIVGFLFTGVIAGPNGIGLVKSVHEVEVLAEIGIVLLLFTIGIEFSFKSLMQIKKSVLLGGSLQVGLTIVVAALIANGFGYSYNQAIFLGFLVSLSSTAIVLKIIQERAEIDSPHAKTSVGILIFQDIIVVPMMLVLPFLSGKIEEMNGSLSVLILKGVGVLILSVVLGKWIVPKVLDHVSKTGNRELFILSVVVICFSIAWMTSQAGLSLALGAFLAGLIISESEYNYQVLGNVLPFKDVFSSLFFVSIGMLLDMKILLNYPILIILIALGVIIVKIILAGIATILLGFPLRTAILVGFKLSQVGEFAFILSKVGSKYGLLEGQMYQVFLAVSILTMAATPFLVKLAPYLADATSKLPIPKKLKVGLFNDHIIKRPKKKNHIIIVGFGLNGKNLSRACTVANIPYIIIEMNAQLAREMRKKGEPIFHGDASHEVVLECADVESARVIVIAISDTVETRKVIKLARKLNPNIYIVVRTRYVQEVATLYELGANEVIPEEFETSIEIFTRVLEKYRITKDSIDTFINEIRSDGYQMFRKSYKDTDSLNEFKSYFPDQDIYKIRISKDSEYIGKTLAEIDLRKKFGVSVLSIQRHSKNISNPDGGEKLHDEDVLVLLGKMDNLKEAIEIFDTN